MKFYDALERARKCRMVLYRTDWTPGRYVTAYEADTFVDTTGNWECVDGYMAHAFHKTMIARTTFPFPLPPEGAISEWEEVLSRAEKSVAELHRAIRGTATP